nr:Chain C, EVDLPLSDEEPSS [synthetic construct]
EVDLPLSDEEPSS